MGLIWPYCVFSQTFYPNLKIFLHEYIRHIRDISQLCRRLKAAQGLVAKNNDNEDDDDQDREYSDDEEDAV